MDLSDNYVASLLGAEAKEFSSRGSGLSSLAASGSRLSADRNKPNTRFLQNVLRSTDAHNSALLAKEQHEARTKRKELERGRRRAAEGTSVSSRRHEVKVSKKRPRDNSRDEHRSMKSRRSHSPEQKSRHRSSKETDSRHHGDRRGQDRPSRPFRTHQLDGNEHCHRRDRSSSVQHGSHRRRKRDSHQDGHRHDSASIRGTPSVKQRIRSPASSTAPKTDSDSESDPLDAFVGPALPSSEPILRAKGRGSRGTAAMDSHFEMSYDPQADTHIDADKDDDWALALEAMRDRQEWKRQGAERLKSAGFTDAQVDRWKSGDKKEETNVTWNKEGESREWDRGKVLEGEVIALRPDWSR